MDIAVVSDTHLPRGSRVLPEACVERLRAADLIVHAGDLMTIPVLEELRGYGEVVAVHGNADDGAVRSVLPARLDLELEGARLVVVHNGGPAAGRLERMRVRFPDARAVVFGHSHIPLHETAADGFQIFNPGSPTDRRRAPTHTMGLARAREGEIAFELVHLD
ncbi:MAG: phosphodiesterase, family [Solirubrobacterales bacterium]|nr:phosphodiesterase, family [Solirubrobacterales bacterium]